MGSRPGLAQEPGCAGTSLTGASRMCSGPVVTRPPRIAWARQSASAEPARAPIKCVRLREDRLGRLPDRLGRDRWKRDVGRHRSPDQHGDRQRNTRDTACKLSGLVHYSPCLMVVGVTSRSTIGRYNFCATSSQVYHGYAPVAIRIRGPLDIGLARNTRTPHSSSESADTAASALDRGAKMAADAAARCSRTINTSGNNCDPPFSFGFS